MRRLAAVALAVAVAATGCGPATKPGTPTTTAQLQARRAAGIPDCPASSDAPAVAGGLPDVSLECMGGTSFVRMSGLRRTPTLVVTWAQWCDPCRAESPMLGRVLPTYGDRLAVVLVDVNDPQPDRAVDFASAAGITRWPVVVDPNWALQTGTGTAKVLPVSYLVGADGVIADKHIGGWKDEASLRDALREKLGVQP